MVDLDRRRAELAALLRLEQVHSRVSQRIARDLAARGLEVTTAQAGVLAGLFELREATSSRLAAHLGLADVTVGRMVSALERVGYVARRRNPADAREQLVAPTQRAREALPAFIEVNNAALDAIFGDVDDVHLSGLIASLDAAVERLGGRPAGTAPRLLGPGVTPA